MKGRPAKQNEAVAAALREERNRLSRELHDRALGPLSAARTQLEWCISELVGTAQPLKAELETAEKTIVRAITELRNLLAENRAGDQVQAGSLERRLKEELAIFSARSGFKIDLQCAVDTHDLPLDVERELYFTLREGVLNALRHARASEIQLSLSRSDVAYKAVLSDNGVGFVVADTEDSNHYGLKGMRERIEKLGGTLELDTAPGKGTRIEIEIPFTAS